MIVHFDIRAWAERNVSPVTLAERLNSVTRWLDYFCDIWPFKTIKLEPNCVNIWKLGSFEILPTSKKLLNKFARAFSQSGQIWPNLVTLTNGLLQLMCRRFAKTHRPINLNALSEVIAMERSVDNLKKSLTVAMYNSEVAMTWNLQSVWL